MRNFTDSLIEAYLTEWKPIAKKTETDEEPVEPSLTIEDDDDDEDDTRVSDVFIVGTCDTTEGAWWVDLVTTRLSEAKDYYAKTFPDFFYGGSDDSVIHGLWIIPMSKFLYDIFVAAVEKDVLVSAGIDPEIDLIREMVIESDFSAIDCLYAITCDEAMEELVAICVAKGGAKDRVEAYELLSNSGALDDNKELLDSYLKIYIDSGFSS